MPRFTSNTGTGEPALSAASEGDGIRGETTGITHSSGVVGLGSNVDGIAAGVTGTAQGFGPGVIGLSDQDCGVIGLHGQPHLEETAFPDVTKAGVFGASEEGPGLLGYSRTGLAGQFYGDVHIEKNLVVDGDLFLPGADCAELFAGVDHVEPGDVVVIGRDGVLQRSDTPYDKRVAGVVSGAGQFRAGMLLDSGNVGPHRRFPVALIGKVYCKVDARAHAIEVGDLLTTSSTAGHAMKAAEPSQAFGTVLGKALADFDAGVGLLPVLVCLQ
jgi:hypothetical protein